jgi:hypothetical protein
MSKDTPNAGDFIVTTLEQELQDLRLDEHGIELVHPDWRRDVVEFEVKTTAGVERWEARLTLLRRTP